MRLRAGALAICIAAGIACDDGPTAPSSGLTLTCPAPMSVQTSSVPVTVTFPAPTASGGQPPVTITCAPASGTAFPAGPTTIECRGTDGRGQTTTCRSAVNVVRVPTLEATRFLAFGDSITAGEVTVPASTATVARPPVLTQVVVPSASYPSQLLTLLLARYTTQTADVAMTNAGVPGESVAQSVPRLGQLLANGSHQVLLLLDGYNDLLASGAVAIPRVARALDTMARDARARGLRVYLAQLTPPIPGRQRSIPDAVIRQMNDEIRVIAAGEGAVLVDLYAALATNVTQYIGVDGLHPTEAGYRRMADEFFIRIRETMEVR